MKVTTKTIICVLVLLLFGYGVYEMSGMSGMEELERLCEKDAGVEIYKTVEVDGYYDEYSKDGSLRHLIRSDFKFIEFCDYNPSIHSHLDDPGCARYTRVLKNSDMCDSEINKILNEVVIEPYVTFKEKYCIAFNKIDKPSAKFSYHSDYKIWKDWRGISEFTRSDVYIKNSNTNEILGRYVSYSFNVNPGSSSAKFCSILDDRYPSYAQSKLIESVLKPIKDQ